MNRSTRFSILGFAALSFFLLAIQPLPAVDFVRGDANDDGVVTVGDAHKIVSFLFLTVMDISCGDALDFDNSGEIQITDAIELLRYLVLGDVPPPAPFPDPGPDDSSTEDVDVDYPCESYGGGTPLEDPSASLRILNSVAPGGNNRTASIMLAMSNSHRIGGYSAEVDLGGIGVRSEPTWDGLFDLTGTAILPCVMTALTNETTGHLKIGFLPNFTGGLAIPVREHQLALKVQVCLEPGTPAGDYPITLIAGEMAEHRTGRRIAPATTSGTLTVLEDVSGPECVLDPSDVHSPNLEPLEIAFELGDSSGAPGNDVLVPFLVSMSDHACGDGVRFSVDFDEEVLQLIEVEAVLERPDGEPLPREDRYINDQNATPGSAGLDEGFVTGRYRYGSLVPDEQTCFPVNETFVFLNFRFRIQPDAPLQVTEVRFLDGGEFCGTRNCWKIDNGLWSGGVELPPEFVNSFIFVNGRVNIVPDVTLFVRGDANGDETVDMSDAVQTLGFLFQSQQRPVCFDAADANDDGKLNISDPVATLMHLYLGGAPLPPPNGTPGEDPTADAMTCALLGQ